MVEAPRPFDPLIDQLPSRFVVGIDLGTTNSAVSYVDTSEAPWQVRNFLIPQIVAPGQWEARETLPSFHFQAVSSARSSPVTNSPSTSSPDAPERGLKLPWSQPAVNYAVGVWARDEGARVPGRLVASAKSWLCHSGVDRTADLLPWHAAEDVDRLSPVEASARYLAHIRAAWNHAFPEHDLTNQSVVLTLPASFDEVARELTVQAAARAGLPRVVLIEEPQAAFYAWVYKHRNDWHELVRPGQKILICDIGGGTSDFTLLRVRRALTTEGDNEGGRPGGTAASGAVEFHRVAVGEHLILGGDNLDLALARQVEGKLGPTTRLETRQWDVLVRICRQAKETLLGEQPPESLRVHVPALGSRLIGGGVQVELARAEVEQLLVDGFLPSVPFSDVPARRQSGFQEFGLPFAPDAGITRYLAQFLRVHQHSGEDEPAAAVHPARPDIVLFNGGFFASPVLRQRLLEVLESWFAAPSEPGWQPLVLDHDRLDLAVARGAAYYGMVRRGEGVRITANLARSYYVGVESDPPAAVCLLPGDTAPGQHVELSQRAFSLTIGQPVEFPLFVSSTRLTDRPGALVEINPEQMRALPAIGTVLRAQRRAETGTVPVRLHALLTEIGTIELWCSELGAERSWKLQFDVRSATQTDLAAHQAVGEKAGFVDEATWSRCETILRDVFGTAAQGKPESLMKRLAESLDSPRQDWPPTLLRRIWETLMAAEAERKRSAAHEARWLNLLGFALRPGYGLPVDDWRVAETWRAVRGKLAFAAVANRIEALVLWRRIAGGLSAGQQRALADPILASLRDLGRRALDNRGLDRSRAAGGASELIETWNLMGALELLPVPSKLELGDLIVALLSRGRLTPQHSALLWTVGRLGQRVPTYGPLNSVTPPDRTAAWLDALLQRDDPSPATQLAIMQLARRTDDRYRELPERSRVAAANWLQEHAAPPHLVTLVTEGGQLDADEQTRVFGEALPKGLRIL